MKNWTVCDDNFSVCFATICHIEAHFKDIKVFYLSEQWRRRCVSWWFMPLRLTKIKTEGEWSCSIFRCIMHSQTYLLRLRERESVAALIFFCASTWVMSSALALSMDTTQSPTPTPAWAAFPPGVSWGGKKKKTGTESRQKLASIRRQEVTVMWIKTWGAGLRAPIVKDRLWDNSHLGTDM